MKELVIGAMKDAIWIVLGLAIAKFLAVQIATRTKLKLAAGDPQKR